MIGETIGGAYKVLDSIGEGGVGEVYRCRDLQLGRDVAVKVLKSTNPHAEEVKRFVAEGRKLAALNHPNVVQIYQFGTHEGLPYFLMEYLEGQTLRALIGEKRIPLAKALQILSQVAAGLESIHGKGIVHRDLSTKNIMIAEDGTAKILDLGLSKDLNSASTVAGEGRIAGTIFYMSPEQIQGESLTCASDIFTFGIVAYELLTGRHPFEAEHHMAVMYKIANRPHEPLAPLADAAPPEICHLVDRCLAKRSEERPAIAEIRATLSQPPTSANMDTTIIASHAPIKATVGLTFRNPYLNRVMIKRAEDFFGREREVRRIYARLNATPPGSVSVVGDRKIGKSSLLNFVYMRHNRRQYLQHPESMVMAFLDLQQEKGMTLEKFAHLLVSMVAYETKERVDLEGCSNDLDGIGTMVERLDHAQIHLTIILDEFEAITTNPNFALEFFSFLRYLANHYNVAYLTSSARDLQDLCHTKEVSDSPFFNIFSTMRLGAMERPEAEQLISVPSERAGYPLGPYCDPIIEMAGLFPFFIQIACSHALEYLDENPKAGAPHFDAIRSSFYEEAKFHFRFIWDKISQDERSALVRIAGGRSIPDSYRHLLDDLERHDLVVRNETATRLFASTFREFVATEGGEQHEGFLRRLFGRVSR